MKITASVRESLDQDHAPCSLHLPIFSYMFALLLSRKIKSCCNCYFPQQIRYRSVQLYILQDHFSVMIGFNMINKHYIFPIVYTM